MRLGLPLATGIVITSVAFACGSDASGGEGAGGASGSGGAVTSGGTSSGGGTVTGGSGGADASLGGSSGAGGSDARPEAGAALGSFELTYYWVTNEDEFTGTKDTNLYDSSCNLLATVTAKFAASLKLEGTGRLSDGRILNYDEACSCPTSPCYLVADAEHPWGYGVKDVALVPFRSIAVDPSVIAYGTKLYVPELDGVAMPGEAPWGNFTHDGCVRADDTGGAIIGQHIDWFVALKPHYLTLDGLLGLSSVNVHDGGARCP